MKIVATRQDQCLRELFAIDVRLYNPYMLVFVDETGTDMRDNLRKYMDTVSGANQCFHINLHVVVTVYQPL